MDNNITDITNFDRLNHLFESTALPEQVVHKGKIEFIKKVGQKSFGIINERNLYVVKECNKDGKLYADDFTYIQHPNVKAKYSRKTIQEAIRLLNAYILENQYQLNIPVATPEPEEEIPASVPNTDAPAEDPINLDDTTDTDGLDDQTDNSEESVDGDNDTQIQKIVGKLGQLILNNKSPNKNSITVGALKSIISQGFNVLTDDEQGKIADKVESEINKDDNSDVSTDDDGFDADADTNTDDGLQDDFLSDDTPVEEGTDYDHDSPQYKNLLKSQLENFETKARDLLSTSNNQEVTFTIDWSKSQAVFLKNGQSFFNVHFTYDNFDEKFSYQIFFNDFYSSAEGSEEAKKNYKSFQDIDSLYTELSNIFNIKTIGEDIDIPTQSLVKTNMLVLQPKISSLISKLGLGANVKFTVNYASGLMTLKNNGEVVFQITVTENNGVVKYTLSVPKVESTTFDLDNSESLLNQLQQSLSTTKDSQFLKEDSAQTILVNKINDLKSKLSTELNGGGYNWGSTSDFVLRQSNKNDKLLNLTKGNILILTIEVKGLGDKTTFKIAPLAQNHKPIEADSVDDTVKKVGVIFRRANFEQDAQTASFNYRKSIEDKQKGYNPNASAALPKDGSDNRDIDANYRVKDVKKLKEDYRMVLAYLDALEAEEKLFYHVLKAPTVDSMEDSKMKVNTKAAGNENGTFVIDIEFNSGDAIANRHDWLNGRLYYSDVTTNGETKYYDLTIYIGKYDNRNDDVDDNKGADMLFVNNNLLRKTAIDVALSFLEDMKNNSPFDDKQRDIVKNTLEFTNTNEDWLKLYGEKPLVIKKVTEDCRNINTFVTQILLKDYPEDDSAKKGLIKVILNNLLEIKNYDAQIDIQPLTNLIDLLISKLTQYSQQLATSIKTTVDKLIGDKHYTYYDAHEVYPELPKQFTDMGWEDAGATKGIKTIINDVFDRIEEYGAKVRAKEEKEAKKASKVKKK